MPDARIKSLSSQTFGERGNPGGGYNAIIDTFLNTDVNSWNIIARASSSRFDQTSGMDYRLWPTSDTSQPERERGKIERIFDCRIAFWPAGDNSQ